MSFIPALSLFFCHAIQSIIQANNQTWKEHARKECGVRREEAAFLFKSSYIPRTQFGALYNSLFNTPDKLEGEQMRTL